MQRRRVRRLNPHHNGGVASSEHCSVEPVAVDDIICDRQRRLAGSPGGVSDAGKAADDVLKQGKIGVENWTEHVQAQGLQRG